MRPDHPSTRRIAELDGIRGLAALSILTYHLKPNLLPMGWAAVDVFFVLSGYLITSILLGNVGSDRFFSVFYVRRGLRIWPVYYLTILVALLVNFALPKPYSLANLPYLLTFTQNIQYYVFKPIPPFLPIFGHFWTLAMEEQYYVIWPAIVYFVPSRGGLVAISFAFLAICLVMRGLGFDGTLLFTRGDGFALGSLLAILHGDSSRTQRGRAWLTRLFGLAWSFGWGVVLAKQLDLWPISDSLQILMVNLGAFGLLGLVLEHTGKPSTGLLRLAPLCYVGTISYGLYVYHIPILWAVELVFRRFGMSHPVGPDHPWWRAVLELVLSLIVASASWFWFEKPILGLKDRFVYRDRATPVNQVPASS